MSVKEALVGTWKLLVTSEADGVVGGGGLTASATPPYGRLVAQYQAFRLPYPYPYPYPYPVLAIATLRLASSQCPGGR